MEKPIKKFLEFNGKVIYFLSADGQYWVAIKPICDALGVNYDRQQKTLKEDIFLGQLYAMQHIVAADGRIRKMNCLPEKYVYGWIFKMQSSATGFQEFQHKCYDLLYDYFHGVLAKRISTLATMTDEEREIAEVQKRIAASEDGKLLQTLTQKKKAHSKTLKGLDVELQESQLTIFN